MGSVKVASLVAQRYPQTVPLGFLAVCAVEYLVPVELLVSASAQVAVAGTAWEDARGVPVFIKLGSVFVLHVSTPPAIL